MLSQLQLEGGKLVKLIEDLLGLRAITSYINTAIQTQLAPIACDELRNVTASLPSLLEKYVGPLVVPPPYPPPPPLFNETLGNDIVNLTDSIVRKDLETVIEWAAYTSPSNMLKILQGQPVAYNTTAADPFVGNMSGINSVIDLVNANEVNIAIPPNVDHIDKVLELSGILGLNVSVALSSSITITGLDTFTEFQPLEVGRTVRDNNGTLSPKIECMWQVLLFAFCGSKYVALHAMYLS